VTVEFLTSINFGHW